MTHRKWLVNSSGTLDGFVRYVSELYHKHGYVTFSWTTSAEPGTQSMLNTWMMWMGQTAIHMSAHGVTMPLYIDSKGNHHGTRTFTKDDAHALFTMTYLGSDEKGRRKTWSRTKNPNEQQASMEDRVWAMDRHIEWCAERGIQITIPADGEYQEERRELEARAA